MFALTNQRSVNKPLFPIGPAPNDREIFFPQRVPLHQQSKRSCCHRGFRNQHQPACLAIKSVDDGDLSATGDLEGEQFAQLFPQGGCAVRLGRMDQKKRGLIDDDIIIGFIYNFEVENWSNEVNERYQESSSNGITPPYQPSIGSARA